MVDAQVLRLLGLRGLREVLGLDFESLFAALFGVSADFEELLAA